MTGRDSPIRQPANTRVSALLIVNLQGRSQLPRHDPALGSSGRSVVHTPRHRETGRPRAAQFASWAVYIPGGGTTWRGGKGARDGDSRSALKGAGGGWRGVPAAGRVPPAGAAGALLPDA